MRRALTEKVFRFSSLPDTNSRAAHKREKEMIYLTISLHLTLLSLYTYLFSPSVSLSLFCLSCLLTSHFFSLICFSCLLIFLVPLYSCISFLCCISLSLLSYLLSLFLSLSASVFFFLSFIIICYPFFFLSASCSPSSELYLRIIIFSSLWFGL